MTKLLRPLLLALTMLTGSVAARAAEPLDLRRVTVDASQAGPRGDLAARMLIEEIEQRTQVRWRRDDKAPPAGETRVRLLLASALTSQEQDADLQPPDKAEAYRIRVQDDGERRQATVVGRDDAGVMFGVGRLLRLLRLGSGAVTLAGPLEVSSAPAIPMRGHQLGYRPKTNSYDAWDERQWEQYYRDLIVFGTNAVELVPPRTDDHADSPHFPVPQLDMMARMSQLADDYGLAVWIWFPAMDPDYSDPATVEACLAEWGAVFARLPRIDCVFLPGGDPGRTPPRLLLPLLEKQTAVLHRTHPGATTWVSPQSFSQQWLDEFLEILRAEPSWLTGVVYGPQVRISLPEFRAAVPKRYPIRHYPDITHSRQCQYPVPNWDRALAFTHGRECINPRPGDQTAIFRRLQSHADGFVTYSEGCNDDVNKFIWSGLGWDPSANTDDILRDYAGYFLGDAYRDRFAAGLVGLEKNWQSPVQDSTAIPATLALFQDLERSAGPAIQRNWRFQMALYRAYYDAYIQARLEHETNLESQAMECLRGVRPGQELEAMAAAEQVFETAPPSLAAKPLQRRAGELADALFDSIRLQSSVQRHQAIAVGRGASLDTLEYPLSNAAWLKTRFRAIRTLREPAQRAAAIAEIVNWTDPGPGGFYDDLGCVGKQPHLVTGRDFAQDPPSLASSRCGFAGPELVRVNHAGESNAWRTSWLDHAESLVDAPLTMRYDGLDPQARYKLRVVYAGDALERPIRCEAAPDLEIHPLIAKPSPIAPVEFDIPAAATQSGQLTLRWYRKPGLGDNGRGCQVSEAWLIRRPEK